MGQKKNALLFLSPNKPIVGLNKSRVLCGLPSYFLVRIRYLELNVNKLNVFSYVTIETNFSLQERSVKCIKKLHSSTNRPLIWPSGH